MAEPDTHAPFKAGDMAGPVNVLACDFDRAISLARLAGTQVFLMQQARELCWSKALARCRSPLGRNALPDPEPFAFDADPLARTLGCDRSVINRNIRALKRMNILVPHDRLNLKINKHYRTWVNEKGDPLLSSSQIEYAESGVAMGGYRLPEPEPEAPEPGTKKSRADMDATDVGTKKSQGGRNSPGEDEKVPAPPNGAGAGPDARSGNSSSLAGIEEKTPLKPPADGGPGGGGSAPPGPGKPPPSTPEQADEAGCAVGRLVFEARRDQSLAEAAATHARMMCHQYPAPAVVSSYMAVCREKIAVHKWGQWVATNLHNRAAAGAPASGNAAPQPPPDLTPRPRTPEQEDFLRRMREAGV